MKTFSSKILGSLFVLFSVSCGGSFSFNHISKLSESQMINHEGNSTVALVYTIDDNLDAKVSDVRPTCTAVWVDDTHILTAFHCAKGIREKLQEKQDAKEKNLPPCEGLEAALHLCSTEVPEHRVIAMQDLPIHYVTWAEEEGLGHDPTGQHLSKVVGWDSDHDLAL